MTHISTIDPGLYYPVGDKKNSDFFDEYRLKIYERRAASGLDELHRTMAAVVVQVGTGDGVAYLCELYLMTPYRLAGTWLSVTHRVYVLQNATSPLEVPAMIVMEPLSHRFEDGTTRLNRLYPSARNTPNARYLGEIFAVRDLAATARVLESHDIRFETPGDTENGFYTLNVLRFTAPSDYTENRVGYTAVEIEDGAPLGIGQRFELTAEQQSQLAAAGGVGEQIGVPEIVLGLDHLATRVLAGEREDAILEFLTLSPYYFWGAYDIADMNSSTNVTRHPKVDDDKLSPAKVFTANNVPSFVNSFEGRPMPTEDFVRNYGRRLHHMAYEVRDKDHGGEKNVDYIVAALAANGVAFLADVVGACDDEPDLKQIFSKHSVYSILITEYIERCHGYKGFFTKANVAALTEAAGIDERLELGHVFD